MAGITTVKSKSGGYASVTPGSGIAALAPGIEAVLFNSCAGFGNYFVPVILAIGE